MTIPTLKKGVRLNKAKTIAQDKRSPLINLARSPTNSKTKIRYKYGKNTAEMSSKYCHRNAALAVADNVTPERPTAHAEKAMQEKNHALLILLARSVRYTRRLKTIPDSARITVDVLNRFIVFVNLLYQY